MTVLVTGATGELGAGLVAALQAEGRAVRILSRRPFLAARRFGLEADIHEWHPGVEPAPAAALAGVATVIHLAGAPLVGVHAAAAVAIEHIKMSRTVAIERLAAALGGERVHLIVASVAPVSEIAGTRLTEASPRDGPDAPLWAAALAWEAAARSLKAGGGPVTIVRLGLLLGPDGALGPLVRLATMGLHPDLDGRIIPGIATGDAARLLAGLVARPDIEGVLNGVAPEPLKGEDLARMLRTAQRSPVGLRAPHRLLARRLGPLAPLLRNRARVVPQRLSEMGAAFEHPDPRICCEAAIAALFEARPPVRLPWRRRASLPTVRPAQP